jgi:hypothetical protein
VEARHGKVKEGRSRAIMSFDIKEAAARAAANRVEPRVNSRPYALSIETGVFLCLALLKLIVVFNPLLI